MLLPLSSGSPAVAINPSNKKKFSENLHPFVSSPLRNLELLNKKAGTASKGYPPKPLCPSARPNPCFNSAQNNKTCWSRFSCYHGDTAVTQSREKTIMTPKSNDSERCAIQSCLPQRATISNSPLPPLSRKLVSFLLANLKISRAHTTHHHYNIKTKDMHIHIHVSRERQMNMPHSCRRRSHSKDSPPYLQSFVEVAAQSISPPSLAPAVAVNHTESQGRFVYSKSPRRTEPNRTDSTMRHLQRSDQMPGGVFNTPPWAPFSTGVQEKAPGTKRERQ